MTISSCPKCRKKSSSTVQCEACGLIFEEYERQKQQSLGQVYQLVSRGDLDGAKTLAEQLPGEFPDSQSDFLILLSNINRDINVTSRYQQALESFERGDCSETVLLLRNIKAFSSLLDEKVISLRRKAERYADHDALFEQAVEKYERGRFAAAAALFGKIEGHSRQDEINGYLQQLEERKNDLLRQAVNLLKNNTFDLAREKFEELREAFPDAGAEIESYLTIISRRNEIKEQVLAAGHEALQAERYLEARVIFSFLNRQFPELQPSLAPHVEEIGSRAVIALVDIAEQESIDFASLGLRVEDYCLFAPDAVAAPAGGSCRVGSVPAPVEINPEPLADPVNEPVDIDGEEVADFIC